MAWEGVRRLALPTALTITSIALTLACGDDDDGSQQPSTLVQCSEVSSTECKKCLTPDGGIDCAASSDCHYDPGDDACFTGIA